MEHLKNIPPRRWEEQLILLRDTMKLGKIVKVLPDEKYLVSYYDESNKFKYCIITEMDIMDEEEYKIIQKRINSINKLID
jgi:hypothetical protein